MANEYFKHTVSGLMGNFDNILAWGIKDNYLHVFTEVGDITPEALTYELYGMDPDGLGADGWMSGDIEIRENVNFIPKVFKVYINQEEEVNLKALPKI